MDYLAYVFIHVVPIKIKKDRLAAQIEGCSVVFSYIFTLGCLEILGTAKGCLG